MSVASENNRVVYEGKHVVSKEMSGIQDTRHQLVVNKTSHDESI